MVVILGGSLWGMAQRFRGRGGNGVGGGAQWPNPNTGQKSLLDRARGKKDDQPS
jgi:hypothetical protein